MVTRTFKVKKHDLEHSPLRIFQHKLRTLMNCYTIRDIILDEQEFIIMFKKSHKISGIKMKDSKEYTARYEVIETDNPKEVILKLMI